MLSEAQLKQIREGLSGLAAPPELVLHQAPEEAALTSKLLEIATQIQEATDGAVVLRPGDGVGLPGLPCLTIAHEGAGKIHYLASPQGPEQQPFLEALSGTSAQGAGLEQLKGLSKPAHLAVFIAATCPHCPRAVSAANRLALAGPSVTTTIIDAQLFPDLAESFHARSVPLTVLDQELSLIGVVPADELAQKIAERDTDEHLARVVLSLVEQNRLGEVRASLETSRGLDRFVAAWRRSTTGQRMGLLLAAGEVLEADRAAMDHCVSGLLPVLGVDDAALRGDTADLLGRIGHAAAQGGLEPLLSDPNPDVAEIAEEALDEIKERSTGG